MTNYKMEQNSTYVGVASAACSSATADLHGAAVAIGGPQQRERGESCQQHGQV